MLNPKNDYTKKRYQNVYSIYLEVNQRHGKYAAMITQKSKYIEVSEIVGLCPERVAEIVKYMSKQVELGKSDNVSAQWPIQSSNSNAEKKD